MRLIPARLGPLSGAACDAVGLLALALTPDVERAVLLVPLLVAPLALASGWRLPDRLLLAVQALLVLSGFLSAGGAPDGTVIARVLVPAHALLWLARDERKFRFWRIGIALIDLVLAAILSPEAHMFVLIFLFVLLGSLALSLGFLERNFQTRDPDSLRRPLRPAFLGAVVALSFLIFLSSLLIFPVLPRSNWGEGSGTSAGYSDVVSFQQGILQWAKQDQRPALWIFRENPGDPWTRLVPQNLVRGQALEEFTGSEWRAAAPGAGYRGGRGQAVRSRVEILRQAMPSDALPAPYGALRLQPMSSAISLHRLPGGEWLAPGSRHHNLRYLVELGAPVPDSGMSRGGSRNLRFDPALFPGIARLAQSIAAAAEGPEARLRALEAHFREGPYEYAMLPVAPVAPGTEHPVEKFLRDKRGHCELYATATALLLRAMGIPARLAIGFRVRFPSRGDVLTVHNSDAHAWVEAWIEGQGWSVVDVTPVEAAPGWWRVAGGELYDWVGAYWHRYILEYEFDLSFSWNSTLSSLISSAILLLGLALHFRRRRLLQPPRARLSWILERFEDDLIHRAGIFPELASRDIPEVRAWYRRYQRLRFGRGEPGRDELRRFERQSRELIRAVAPAR